MIQRLLPFLPLLLTSGASKGPDLPPCPTHMSFLPQNLPMHCRMPMPPRLPNMPGAPPGPYAYPYPPPFPGTFGGSPPGFPLGSHLGMPPSGPPGDDLNPPSGPLLSPSSPPPPGPPGPPPLPPPGIPPGMPPPPGFPPSAVPFPMAMHMPMVPPLGGQKLPIVVMPFYSPEPRQSPHKRPPRPRPRPPRPLSDTSSDISSNTGTSSDTSSSTDTDSGSWWRDRITRRGRMRARMNGRLGKKHRIRHKGHRHIDARRTNREPPAKRERERHYDDRVLTPMLQYVNKDGIVIFEKKISKGEAKDWLKAANNENESEPRKEMPNTPERPVMRKKTTIEEGEVTTKVAQEIRIKKRRPPMKPGRL